MRARVASKANADVEETGAGIMRPDAQSKPRAPREIAGAEDRAVHGIVPVVSRRSNIHLALKVRETSGSKSIRPNRATEGSYLRTDVERVHEMLARGVRYAGVAEVAPELIVFWHVDVSRHVAVREESTFESKRDVACAIEGVSTLESEAATAVFIVVEGPDRYCPISEDGPRERIGLARPLLGRRRGEVDRWPIWRLLSV